MLQRPYIHKFESFLLDQLEVTFAQLPLEVESVSMVNISYHFFQKNEIQLPRPPIYLNQQNEEWSEGQSRESMFCLIRLLLHSMKESNRIASQLSTAFDLLSNSETVDDTHYSNIFMQLIQTTKSCTLSRILLIVLRVHYRDIFSLSTKNDVIFAFA